MGYLRFIGEKIMTVTTPKNMTLEEFLQFDDGTDNLYELENGKLISMPLESELNRRIAMFLLAYFLKLGIPYYRLSMKTEMAVYSRQVGVRVPDLVLFSEELAQVMQSATRSLILMDMPQPLLVIEVVSPNQENRDYRYKRSEYATRGIPEYWIVDPIQQKVTVLQWVEGLYEEQVFTGDMVICSPLFSEIKLTVNDIWHC